MTLADLMKYLEEVNVNTFLREIDEHFQSLFREYGEDADTRLLFQIQRLQSLAELLNHKRLNYLSSLLQNTEIFEEKSTTDSKPQKNKIPMKKNLHNSPIKEMIKNYGKENFQTVTIDNEKQESGDMHFASTILPYEPRYIRELCRKGTIPHSRPAGKYVFFRKDLEEWLQMNSSQKDTSKFEIGKMGRK